MRPRVTAAAALALGLTGLLPATLPAQALARPTVSPLAEVNINLGLTQRVTAKAVGATSYEWRIWTAARGWTLLARGGSAYASINFTGDATRHMGMIEVTAINSAGSTASNRARLRVWGINSSYPAAIGSTVRTSGWAISVGRPTVIADNGIGEPGIQARTTVTRLTSPAAEPLQTVGLFYLSTQNLESDVYPVSCDYTTAPAFEDIASLAAGQSGAGNVCAINLTAAQAKGGRWVVEAYPSESATTPGPLAYFRSI